MTISLLRRHARRVLTTIALVAPALVAGGGAPPAYAAFPGHNGVIVFSNNNDIWTATPDGTTFHELTQGTFVDRFPAFSPDGRLITFTRDGNVWLMRSDGTHLRQVVDGAGGLSFPSFSPTGNRLIWNGGLKDVFVGALDGTHVHQITGVHGYEPAWSPDGTRIAYWNDPNGEAGIFIAHPDGTHRQQLTGDPTYNDESPDWSPDGKRLVFDRFVNGGVEVTVMPVADPTKARSLVSGLTNNSNPVFSSNGASVAFRLTTASVAGQLAVYSFRSADASVIGRLVGGEQVPDWQPT